MTRFAMMAMIAAGCAGGAGSNARPTLAGEDTPTAKSQPIENGATSDVARYPTTPPATGSAPAFTLPAPQTQKLANGLTVLYVARPELPVVHLTLVTRGGSAVDPPGRAGLAALVADMIDEGAGKYSALGLASAVDLLGASLGTDADWDAATVDVHVLAKNLPAAVGLMADVVLHPTFPRKELSRVRKQRLTDLARGRDEPRFIAHHALATLVYGKDHPYGRLPSTASLKKIKRRDLVAFHKGYYSPETSTLVIAGDIDAAALHPVIERAFAGWPRGTTPPVAIPPPPKLGATTIYVIDKPGAAQSEIRVGRPGVARATPDYFSLVVLNTILGGSFTSRLNSNLREEHGYAYGARSWFDMRRGAGPFVASAAVITAKTAPALAEILSELHRIRDHEVAPAELTRAKHLRTLGMPRTLETTSQVARKLAQLSVYGLSADFLSSYVPSITAVTAADIQHVANEVLHPDEAVVVIVGDAKKIEAGLEALHVGTVKVLAIRDVLR